MAVIFERKKATVVTDGNLFGGKRYKKSGGNFSAVNDNFVFHGTLNGKTKSGGILRR